MNHRMIFSIVGRLMVALAILLLLPFAVAIYFGEVCAWAFAVTIGASLIGGTLLALVFRTRNHIIYAREGLAIVALVWVVVSLIGALPFYLSGEIPSYIDAFFETVSGFTTTGASILKNVEGLSKSLLFWRSFTHWIGGMGVLVFVMALIPNLSDRSIHLMRAEMPGPIVGKLVPRVKDTAKILYLIYIGMTLLEILMLWIGGMPLFDSVLHAFGTAGTGGFGIKSDSIAGYTPYLQWVIAIFMLLFGVNFNLYYLFLIRRFKSALKSAELWLYLGIAAGSVAVITADIYPICKNFEEALRLSGFQVSSILTTTGYATADFNLWPDLSKAVLFLLMFCGGCSGSTAGGLKVSRLLLLFRMVRREIKRMLHPRSVTTVQLEGKTVDDATISGVGTYFALYIFCIMAVFLILSLEPFGMETNFSAAVSCFNNVGPGFAAVGPVSSYADFSVLSKITLSAAMLLGRLEIYPLLIAVLPPVWLRNR